MILPLWSLRSQLYFVNCAINIIFAGQIITIHIYRVQMFCFDTHVKCAIRAHEAN